MCSLMETSRDTQRTVVGTHRRSPLRRGAGRRLDGLGHRIHRPLRLADPQPSRMRRHCHRRVRHHWPQARPAHHPPPAPVRAAPHPKPRSRCPVPPAGSDHPEPLHRRPPQRVLQPVLQPPLCSARRRDRSEAAAALWPATPTICYESERTEMAGTALLHASTGSRGAGHSALHGGCAHAHWPGPPRLNHVPATRRCGGSAGSLTGRSHRPERSSTSRDWNSDPLGSRCRVSSHGSREERMRTQRPV